MTDETPPYMRFTADGDPRPSGKVRARPDRVVVSVTLGDYYGQRHASVSFDDDNEWVRDSLVQGEQHLLQSFVLAPDPRQLSLYPSEQQQQESEQQCHSNGSTQ